MSERRGQAANMSERILKSNQSSSMVFPQEEIKEDPKPSKKAKVMIDPVEAENFFSENLLFNNDDQNFVLDTTQDLPIRKPQSAYVIFGKLVRINCGVTNAEERQHNASESRHKSDRGRQADREVVAGTLQRGEAQVQRDG